MRLRNVPGAPELLASHPKHMVLEAQTRELRGKWQTMFEKEQPIHLEIGMGKGQFIMGMAKANPEINYIGIEVFDSVMVKALEKQLEEQLPNVMLLKVDARFLEDIFAPGELQHIYLNFSDPWPKVRHAKRRLTHDNFLKLYEAILPKEGEIRFKSDNRPLFEFSLASMNNYGMLFDQVWLDLHEDEPEYNIRTEYEEKWSAKGSKIYRIVARFRK